MRIQPQEVQQVQEELDSTPLMFNMDDLPPELQEQHGMATESATPTPIAPVVLGNIDWTRVGRNDAFPCGSGTKFKACHYPTLRSEGVI